jgi:ATP-dependent DNA helicase RecQ
VEEWQRLARALLQQGLLSQTFDSSFPLLRLNELSREVLGQRRQVFLPALPKKVAPTPASVSSHRERPLLEPEAEGLFHHLRILRKKLADERSVPPYVVFADNTLQALASQRPLTQEHFLRIPGIGRTKLTMYYEVVERAIREYCEEHNLPMGLDAPVAEAISTPSPRESATRVHTAPTHVLTLGLYQQGLSVEQIAQERNLAVSTIMGHLITQLEVGKTFDITLLVPDDRYQVIADALLQVGDDKLTPVKDFLGDAYSYNEIRIVRAVERRKS